MNRIKPILLAFLFMVPFLYSCEQGTDVVESGTYQGTVDEVEPEKTEIYVETDDNQRLELYFNDNTSLTRNGETVAFDQLEKGQRVEVQVEKVGQRLEPLAVRIME
jgi:cold shock protein